MAGHDGAVPGHNGRRTWLVSVDLPIEAATPGEAVDQFWAYVRELGPDQLPAFVSPTEDELAMQAYVRGRSVNLDPEEDDEDDEVDAGADRAAGPARPAAQL